VGTERGRGCIYGGKRESEGVYIWWEQRGVSGVVCGGSREATIHTRTHSLCSHHIFTHSLSMFPPKSECVYVLWEQRGNPSCVSVGVGYMVYKCPTK
jgi:hypothetical protein